jgi:hypothetical protein
MQLSNEIERRRSHAVTQPRLFQLIARLTLGFGRLVGSNHEAVQQRVEADEAGARSFAA